MQEPTIGESDGPTDNDNQWQTSFGMFTYGSNNNKKREKKKKGKKKKKHGKKYRFLESSKQGKHRGFLKRMSKKKRKKLKRKINRQQMIIAHKLRKKNTEKNTAF